MEKVYLETFSALSPYVIGSRKGGAAAARDHILMHLYLNYPREWLTGQKQLVRAVLKHPPSLFRGLPTFNYELYDLRDGDISVVPVATNTFALHALVNSFTLTTHNETTVWPFKLFRVDILPTCMEYDCEGSREELTDFCLLWLYADQTNTLHTQVVKKALRTVLDAEPQGGYTDWLHERLRQAGHNETEWLLSCMRSSNPDLAWAATRAARRSRDSRIQDAACEIMLNRKMRGDVRQNAMGLTVKSPTSKVLVALTEVLDDQSPVFAREFCPQFLPQYPLTNSTTFLAMRPLWEWRVSHLTNTLGKEALESLTWITKQDFGKDVQAWKRWVGKTAENQHFSQANMK